MFKLQELYFFLFYLFFVDAEVDYCKLPCGNKINTVCARRQYDCGAGPSCGKQFNEVSLPKQLKEHIVHLHNSFRNKVATGKEHRGGVQPKAANMNALTWNKDLQYGAQCWTNNCVFEHDECRRTTTYESVGQNLAIQWTSGNSKANMSKILDILITSWYDEVEDFPASSVGQYQSNHGTGHYSQLVWAKTEQIGCAVTSYEDDGWNAYLLACNYGPQGNYIGEPVYLKGDPASKCPSGQKHNKYHGLCSA